MKELRFLKKYTGTLLHDHETVLYHFGTEYTECNVHIIRYFRKNTEETGNKWSGEMISLFCEMNNTRKGFIEQGRNAFSEDMICRYEQRYHAIVSDGHEENKKTLHKYVKTDESTLLNRLDKYSHNHLLFLRNFAVAFDDNISERDLRKAKNQQKMAGGFRKGGGHKMYCSILNVIETIKK